MTGRVARAVPASGWLRAYDRAWLRADLVAGVSAGAVVVPQAMAYATVAGLPVQVGLMTCIVPVVVYALLGGSRRLSLSTTSTIMTLAAAAIVGLGGSAGRDPVGTTATLTLLVGVILVLARLLRLGFLVESVSELVLFGLKIAVGLDDRRRAAAEAARVDEASGKGFVGGLGNVVHHLSDVSAATVALSAGTVAVLVLLRRFGPRVPGPRGGPRPRHRAGRAGRDRPARRAADRPRAAGTGRAVVALARRRRDARAVRRRHRADGAARRHLGGAQRPAARRPAAGQRPGDARGRRGHRSPGRSSRRHRPAAGSPRPWST